MWASSRVKSCEVDSELVGRRCGDNVQCEAFHVKVQIHSLHPCVYKQIIRLLSRGVKSIISVKIAIQPRLV